MEEKTGYEKILDQIEHYNRIDSHSNTKRVCLEALSHEPHDPWVLSMLTRAYYELREFEACTKTGLASLEYQTPHQQAFIFNILSAERKFAGDHKKAAEYSQKAVEGRPESANFLAQHAENLAYLRRKDEAKALFKRAEEMDPHNYFMLSAQFDFYHDFYRDRKAEEELLSRMMAVSTKPFDLNWKFGSFHLKYGERQKAYDYFVQCMLIKPGDEFCKKMLGDLEYMGYNAKRSKKRVWMVNTLRVAAAFGAVIGLIVIYEYLAAWVF